MTDGLSRTYADLLNGQYDGLDRIVLNGYHRLAHNPGGFRYWWHQLHGSLAPLDNTRLWHMAGRFRRRLRVWARANRIPMLKARSRQRKYELVERYRPASPGQHGVFLILEGRAPAPVWDVLPSGHIRRQTPYPYVTHFHFHVLDPDWGHLTIKLSSQPPFPAQIVLNGHNYLEQQAQKAGVPFTKEGNCFTALPDESRFAALTETFTNEAGIEPLVAVCDRWIYTCLGCALSVEEQKRCRFRYEYSLYSYSCS